jgi:hypothetical protein
VARTTARWLVALTLIALIGEFTARLDDWIFQGTPLAANVDREHDLLFYDKDCIRGRPDGRFTKFHLNHFGFRGPEISADPIPGTTRVMLLGASETFGLYESEGREFAEQLRRDFARRPERVEIVNAAVAGMNLLPMRDYWNHWANQFHSNLVLIYPPTQFYLDDEAPRAIAPRPASANDPIGFRSRFGGRVLDSIKQLDILKTLRARYVVRRNLSGKGPEWLFAGPPADRLKQFRGDLEALGEDISRDGARPVLVTHALSAGTNLSSEDIHELEGLRMYAARARPEVIQAFNAAAAQITREIAAAHGWALIDAAAVLSGRGELFADPVHFNDAGSAAMAALLLQQLLPLLPSNAVVSP